MTMPMKMTRPLSISFVLLSLTACAAQKNGAASPQSPPAQEGSPAMGGADAYAQPQYGGQPAQPGQPPPPPASSPTTPSAEAPRPEPQGSPTSTSTSRSLALSKAASDIEAAQRELDVAGSSCQNACRALGSMDRAAGHLCQLTREDNTHDRCDDAKRRLYSARDRVRSTCGSCPDNQPATDRNAPVPSMR